MFCDHASCVSASYYRGNFLLLFYSAIHPLQDIYVVHQLANKLDSCLSNVQVNVVTTGVKRAGMRHDYKQCLLLGYKNASNIIASCTGKATLLDRNEATRL